MGDLLQATPLMTGLKKKYPDTKLDVLVSSDFASVTKSIPNIDKVIIFNLRQFTPSKKATDENGGKVRTSISDGTGASLTGFIPDENNLTLIKIYRYIEGVIKELKESNYDTVINLSHSKLSATLTTLINIKDIRGITSSDFGNRMVKHPWLKYFTNIIFNRAYNSFNLVDIYLKSGDVESSEDHLLLEVDEESIKYSEKLLSQHGVIESDFLVGFQPGSSLKGRRWSTNSFANMGNRITGELNGKVILFGVESEANQGKEIEEMMDNKPVNTMGKTSVQQLAALVKCCNVLITNDTGTMHIATAVGTKVMGLFFAHAFPFETGPYSRGNIVFQANIPCSPCSYGVNCNNAVCVNYVTVDHLFQVLRLFKDRKTEKILFENVNEMEKIKIFRSEFDQEQMLEFLPAIKRPLTDIDFIRFIYRIMWKKTLNSNDTNRTEPLMDTESEKNVIEKLKIHYDLNEFPKTYHHLRATLGKFNNLWDILKQASRVTEKLIQASSSNPPELNKIKIFGDKIADFDERINLMGHTNPVVKPIIDMFRLGKENLQGADISILAKETLILYEDMKRQAGIIYQLGTQLSESIKQSFDN